MSPEPAAIASLSYAALAPALAFTKPALSLHTVGSALVSPLSEPAGNSLSNASSSSLSLAACFPISLTSPLASMTSLMARISGPVALLVLARLDHVGLRERYRRTAHQRAGSDCTDHRHDNSLLHHKSFPWLFASSVFVAEVHGKANSGAGNFLSRLRVVLGDIA